MTTNRFLPVPILLSALAACGGGVSSEPEPDDAVVLLATSGDERLTSHDFGEVVPSTTSSALGLTITNDGRRTSGPLTVTLSGADAGEFTSENDCEDVALAPRSSCSLRLRFAPTTAGVKHATVRIADSGGVSVELALSGTGRTSALVFTPAEIILPIIEVGTESSTVVTVENAGVRDVTGIAVDVTGVGFSATSSDCAGTLASHATCTVVLRFAPPVQVVSEGRLSLRGAEDAATLALVGSGGRRVTVSSAGGGAGAIVSKPPGIDCGATCTGLFLGGTELQGVPAAGSNFGAWTAGPCTGSTADVCVIPAGIEPVTAAARFDVDLDITVTIDSAGEGLGEVDYRIGLDSWQPCTGHCVVPVASGTTVTVRAVAMSVFTGWSGACTGTAVTCDVVATADRQLTATFARSPGEVSTRFLSIASNITYAPTGELIGVGGGDTGGVVTKASADGSTAIWTRTVPVGASTAVMGFDTDSAGNTFVLLAPRFSTTVTALVLAKVTAAGQLAWSRSIPGTKYYELESAPDNLAVTSTDDVAILTTGGMPGSNRLQVYDGDGTATTPPLWSMQIGYPGGVAAGPAGSVLVAGEDSSSPDNSEVRRFTATGVESLGRLPGGYEVTLTSDSTGAPVAATSGHSSWTVSQDLGIVGGGSIDSPGATWHAVTVDSTDHVAAIKRYTDLREPGGLELEYAAAGGYVFVSNPPIESEIDRFGYTPMSIAGDRAGNVAVLAYWRGSTRGGTVLRVFRGP